MYVGDWKLNEPVDRYEPEPGEPTCHACGEPLPASTIEPSLHDSCLAQVLQDMEEWDRERLLNQLMDVERPNPEVR